MNLSLCRFALPPLILLDVSAFNTDTELRCQSIKQACPHGQTMILDAEVLMVDTTNSKPLPFGTLGVHKRQGTVI